ncbi:helix-turn-helix domain-containing protein [Burkholderia pseudomallei]|uniref:helix-turn-helix domain-containing protein n=1 Tax=Burkholderia pseudomallei TaxID=28450 RepID=UPI0021F751F4|nr:helix-turn-helix domain-containing protein [Burkholderia pseudomallei]MCW0053335.1 helix-turn-helix domain-containing protein [Burkholderia pseudomallei]
MGEELAKRIGAEIARQRKAAGYTQARVGDALGLEKETVSRIETGTITPTLHRLSQFAELFGCPLSALFGEYRGRSLEDSAEVAAALADLPEDARRAALRVVSEFAAVARDREELRRQNEALVARLAELERRYLSETLPPAPRASRKKPVL